MRQVRAPLVSTSGLLEPERAAAAFRLVRVPPAEDLAGLVERSWVLAWDLPDGVSHTQVLVPHPAVNLVVEHDGARVHGIPSGLFERTLRGRGVVVGVKLRPGAARVVVGRPLVDLVDRSLPLVDVLGEHAARALGPRLLDGAAEAPEDAVGVVAEVLREHVPDGAVRASSLDAAAVVARVLSASLKASGGTGPTVADLAAEAGLSVRALERLMREHVGVSPRWVVHRHRVHRAADALAEDPDLDLADLAVRLGWYDQAHLTRQFTAVLGTPPAAYARRCAAGRRRAGVG